MSITTSVNDLIEQSQRLLLEPVSLDGWTPPEVETHEQSDAAENDERERRLKARIDAYLADRQDRLLALRYIREAAHHRAERYSVEAQRWQAKARDQQGMATYCEQLAMNVLVNDRQLSGASEGEPHKVEFDNGVKIGLRITRPVVVSDIDMLPAKLVRVKTTREPDKVAIGKLLKAGEVVSGARLGVNETVDWGR